MPKDSRSGFTLIELLITIVIIAVLSGLLLTVLNIGGLRAKARDSQRVADLEKIQAALEQFYSDYRRYPGETDADSYITPIYGTDPLTEILMGDSTVTLGGEVQNPRGTIYMSSVPIDPVHTSGVCFNNDARYTYSSNESNYIIQAMMEVEDSASASPCLDLFHWNDFGCGYWVDDTSIPANCYAVESP
jgi:prepilin-type N-terminal cleavage/methylation domain-containing protein